MKFLYILIAIIILLVLITVHEFGHYIFGKLLKFKINEFSVGFGKALYSKTKKNGEVFSIRMIPLGGYCAFEGEDEENPTPAAFNNQKPWKRMIVLAGGVFFNFLFGVLTAAIYLMVTGYGVPVVSFLAPDSVNNSLQEGDRIVAVDGVSIEAYRQFATLAKRYELNEEFELTIERKVGGTYQRQTETVRKYDGEAFYFASATTIGSSKIYKDDSGTAVELSLADFNEYLMGIIPETDENGKYIIVSLNSDTVKFYKDDSLTESAEYSDTEIKNLVGLTLSGRGQTLGIVYITEKASYGFFESLLKAWPFCFYICGLILGVLGGIFTGATKIADLGGTITAISQMGSVMELGFSSFLLLLPLLSMNLALFNFLPIPSLDGAREVFVLIESVRGKPINRKVEGMIHLVGLILLFALVIVLDGYHIFAGLV